MNSLAEAWDQRMARLLAKAPERVRSTVDWLRDPRRRAVRICAAIVLIIGGIFSILPVLGLWMLPLGLALLAEDIPGLKGPLERTARWCGRTWRKLRGRPREV